MYGTNHFKKGLKILINDQPYVITHFEHFKPGKGNQFTRTKLKNLITGQNIDRTVKSGEKFPIPDIEYINADFLYKDSAGYHFMNLQNYEQIALDDKLLGTAAHFLIENTPCKLCCFNGRAVGVELPHTMQLKVVQTEPGFKGNTVSGALKPATLETQYTLQVPLHINQGDVIKVDTQNGNYMERISAVR